MRIACIHIPQVALQAKIRQSPDLVGHAVAVCSSGSTVVAYSRQAYSLGVRAGMPAATVRELARTSGSPIVIRTASLRAQSELITSLGEACGALAPVVEVTVGNEAKAANPHSAIYCEVPVGTRGTTFGARIKDLATSLGIHVRIGIADDKFAAWVCASQLRPSSARFDDGSVTTVPRGGSAAFLAPLPLSLLPIAPEVQHMLEVLGVKTLGQFASLPQPSGGRAGTAWSRERAQQGANQRTLGSAADGFDLQGLARGDDPASMRLVSSKQRQFVAESIEVRLESPAWVDAIATLGHRIATVLAGRRQVATHLRLQVTTGDGCAIWTGELGLVPAVADGEQLQSRIYAALSDYRTLAAPSVASDSAHLLTCEVTPVPVAKATQSPADDSSSEVLPIILPLGFSRAPSSVGIQRARRGKQRKRVEVSAQTKLFGG